MTPRGRAPGGLGALARASHPGPTLVVTTTATALGLAAGLPTSRVVVLAAAVLAGQLSIGWANDAVDAERDRAAGRADKPVSDGRVDRARAWSWAWLALLAAVPLSLALGWRAGVTHLAAVAGGWAYDLGVKRTGWSALPFAWSFGLLPAVATLSRSMPAWPPWWAVLSGALLGVAAHLANALPDLADDRAAGVIGLPHRLGGRRARQLAGLLLVVSASVLAVAPPGPLDAFGAGAVAVSAVLAGVGLAVPRDARSRLPFALVALAALVVVVLLVAGLHAQGQPLAGGSR